MGIKEIKGNGEINKGVRLTLENYETLISAIPGGICINNADREFSMIYANQGFYELSGYTEEEFKELFPRGGIAALHPDGREDAAKDAISQMQQTGAFSVKAKLIHKTKGYVWVHFSGRFLPNEGEQGVVCVVMIDITKQQIKFEELSVAVREEKLFRASVLSDAIFIVEYNLSKDKIIEILRYGEPFTGHNGSYSGVVELMAENYVHPDDEQMFITHASIQPMLADFNAGKTERTLEYRRLIEGGEFMWARATTNLVKDSESGDIKGFTYVKDIHEEKMLQIELKYKAESDPLTGLCNKTTTEALIKHELANYVKGEQHALMIIDVDDFKDINDKLGHLSGDIVLTNLADKLKMLFRTNDIVGRLGGDEFFVFMRNISSFDVVLNKAREINKAFKNTYKEKKISCTISASIGIVLCPKHGTDFESLYKNADTALYITKEKGKNSYTVYEGQSGVSYQSARTKVDTHNNAPQKSFKNNKIEYLFKLLYGSNDTQSAVESALELMADHFNFSRGYVFEISPDRKSIVNTIECCIKDTPPMIDLTKTMPIDAIETISQAFYEKGYFVLQHFSEMTQLEKDITILRGTKSMFHFGIFDDGKLEGLIGFDDCAHERVPTDADIDELATICNMLSMFMSKHRATQKAQKSLRTLSAVMDNLDNFAYVIDEQTLEILFMNQKTKDITGASEIGGACYKMFRGNDAPCEDCPVKSLGGGVKKASVEIYNEKFNIWTETTASYIDWMDGKKTCLVNCVDITRHKKKDCP